MGQGEGAGEIGFERWDWGLAVGGSVLVEMDGVDGGRCPWRGEEKRTCSSGAGFGGAEERKEDGGRDEERG